MCRGVESLSSFRWQAGLSLLALLLGLCKPSLHPSVLCVMSAGGMCAGSLKQAASTSTSSITGAVVSSNALPATAALAHSDRYGCYTVQSYQGPRALGTRIDQHPWLLTHMCGGIQQHHHHLTMQQHVTNAGMASCSTACQCTAAA